MLETITQKINEWLLDNLLIAFAVVVMLVVFIYYYFDHYGEKHEENYFEDNASENGSELSKQVNNKIHVDISGAVNNPGVYELDQNARLVELVKLAGGYSDNVSFELLTKKINLAQKLEDGLKLYIPFSWEVPPAQDEVAYEEQGDTYYTGSYLNDTANSSNISASASKTTTMSNDSTLINVNTADKELLTSLNGVGDVYAQKIIDNRPYINEDEFYEKSGLSQSLVDKIIEKIEFD